jgi:hypothetical protein
MPVIVKAKWLLPNPARIQPLPNKRPPETAQNAGPKRFKKNPEKIIVKGKAK